jgi:hypothetical protein
VKYAHVELIMHPRMIDLVDKKWERFARRIFFHRFLITLSYLLIFLITTILDQARTETVIYTFIFLYSLSLLAKKQIVFIDKNVFTSLFFIL